MNEREMSRNEIEKSPFKKYRMLFVDIDIIAGSR